MTVEVEPRGVRFIERGTFTLVGQSTPMSITNVFYWRIGEHCVGLSHERRGAGAPVHLFDLHPFDECQLTSRAGHQCAADLYTARLTLSEEGVDLQWRIEGPKKDEWIAYHYSDG